MKFETGIIMTENLFDLREFHILAVLLVLLLVLFGSRSTAILWLRFGGIRVVLIKDPDGRPHKFLARFSLEFAKTYLGTKDT